MDSQRETFDIFTSVLDIVNQIAEYALHTSRFSLSPSSMPIISANLFECTCESLFKTCNINLLDDPPLKKIP